MVLLKRNQKFVECTDSEELTAFLKQELSNGRIFGQADGVVRSASGLTGFTKTLQEGA